MRVLNAHGWYFHFYKGFRTIKMTNYPKILNHKNIFQLLILKSNNYKYNSLNAFVVVYSTPTISGCVSWTLTYNINCAPWCVYYIHRTSYYVVLCRTHGDDKNRFPIFRATLPKTCLLVTCKYWQIYNFDKKI